MVCEATHLGAEKIAVLKVPANVDKHRYHNDLDRWLIEGNHVADAAAGAANVARGSQTWALWEAFAQQTSHCRQDAAEVRAHIVAVASLWAEEETVICRPSTPGLPGSTKRSARQPALKFALPQPIRLIGKTFHKSFGPRLASELSEWISSIRCQDSDLRWISFMHLFISFQWRAGPISIQKQNGRWLVERGETARLANHTRLGTRIKWFRLALQQFLKDSRADFVTCTTRPYSQWICCFRGAIGFSMVSSEYNLVESFLQSSLGAPATGSGKRLDSVRL